MEFLVENDYFQCPFLGFSVEKSQNFSSRTIKSRFFVENDYFQSLAKFLFRGFCPLLGFSIKKIPIQNYKIEIFRRKWLFSVFGQILILRFLSLIGILSWKIAKFRKFNFPSKTIKSRFFVENDYFLIPCVWQDGALSVSSSHTWLHLDQRGRNKTSNQIGISLKIFLWNFFSHFFSRILRWKIFGFHRTLKYGTWILERSLYLIKFIFVVFFGYEND